MMCTLLAEGIQKKTWVLSGAGGVHERENTLLARLDGWALNGLDWTGLAENGNIRNGGAYRASLYTSVLLLFGLDLGAKGHWLGLGGGWYWVLEGLFVFSLSVCWGFMKRMDERLAGWPGWTGNNVSYVWGFALRGWRDRKKGAWVV